MRKQLKILIAALCLVALLVVIASFSQGQEPRYNGRLLTEWLQDHRRAKTPARPAVADATRAEEAVRQIGTNALPFLLKSLDADRPRWERDLKAILCRAPLPPFINPIRYLDAQQSCRNERCVRAVIAFEILGAQAAPAIPALTDLLNRTNTFRPRFEAAFVLAAIDPDGLPPLLNALANTNYPDHRTILLAINQATALQRQPSNVVNALAFYLKSPNSDTPVSAFDILAQLHVDPAHLEPVLKQALFSPNQGVSYWAARSLHRFPKCYPQLIKALQTMLRHTNATVRCIATNALAQMYDVPASNTGRL